MFTDQEANVRPLPIAKYVHSHYTFDQRYCPVDPLWSRPALGFHLLLTSYVFSNGVDLWLWVSCQFRPCVQKPLRSPATPFPRLPELMDIDLMRKDWHPPCGCKIHSHEDLAASSVSGFWVWGMALIWKLGKGSWLSTKVANLGLLHLSLISLSVSLF